MTAEQGTKTEKEPGGHFTPLDAIATHVEVLDELLACSEYSKKLRPFDNNDVLYGISACCECVSGYMETKLDAIMNRLDELQQTKAEP